MKPCPDCDASLPGIDGACLHHAKASAKEALAALQDMRDAIKALDCVQVGLRELALRRAADAIERMEGTES